MKTLLLCEGKTDGIILSYYLKKCFNWEHVKNIKKLPFIKIDNQNQSLFWYNNGENYLAIVGVGGKDNISKRIKEFSERNSGQDPKIKFNNLIIMIDHDENRISDLKTEIYNWLNEGAVDIDSLNIGDWNVGKVKLSKLNIDQYFEVDILPIIIPKDENGNLERFLLNGLKEVEEDKKIVDQSEKYIDAVKEVSYLSKERYKIKAQLQAVLSVISPEWVFTQIDERMSRVKWENLTKINNIFGKFSKLSEK